MVTGTCSTWVNEEIYESTPAQSACLVAACFHRVCYLVWPRTSALVIYTYVTGRKKQSRTHTRRYGERIDIIYGRRIIPQRPGVYCTGGRAVQVAELWRNCGRTRARQAGVHRSREGFAKRICRLKWFFETFPEGYSFASFSFVCRDIGDREISRLI